MTGSQPALPSHDGAEVVVPAPGPGPGSWAGAASAVRVGGTVWLTWRVRRPLGEGRGGLRRRCAVGRRRALPAGDRGRSRALRRRVPGAASARPAPDRRLEALPVLRHAGLQALVGRQPDRRHRGGPAGGHPARRAARRRAHRGQGPGDHPAARPGRGGVGGVAVLPPTGPAGGGGPHDEPPPEESRRPAVERPRRGAGRSPRPLGREGCWARAGRAARTGSSRGRPGSRPRRSAPGRR